MLLAVEINNQASKFFLPNHKFLAAILSPFLSMRTVKDINYLFIV